MVHRIMSCNVYVDDLAKAEIFYGMTLGLKRGQNMGDKGCFFEIGDNPYGLYVEGGYAPAPIGESQTRASFTLYVDSADIVHERLRGHSEVITPPRDIGKGFKWMQFRDPAGNIVEAVSGPHAAA